MMEVKALEFNVSRVYSARDDKWGIEFDDGVTLHCSKVRDEKRIDQMVAASKAADAEHGKRVQMMIDAVRAHEGCTPAELKGESDDTSR